MLCRTDAVVERDEEVTITTPSCDAASAPNRLDILPPGTDSALSTNVRMGILGANGSAGFVSLNRPSYRWRLRVLMVLQALSLVGLEDGDVAGANQPASNG
jgi:hypothetical protein